MSTGGDGMDAVDVMLEHVDVMARDTAMMEVLGPNPDAGFQYLKQAAEKLDVQRRGPKGLDHARNRGSEASNLLSMFKGEMNVPGNRTFAVVMSTIRQWEVASKLGSAVFSSISDLNAGRLTASMVGMSQTAPVRKLATMLSSPGTRSEMNDAGIIFENAVDLANAAARQTMEDFTIRPAARLSDFTVRFTGLGALTEANRMAFGAAFMNHAAKLKGVPFEKLHPKFQRTLDAYGIGKVGWEAIRKAKDYTSPQGLKLLRFQEVEAAAGRALADRWLEMQASLIEFAVPSHSPRGKAMLSGKKGTVLGETASSFMLFKGFSVALMFSHVSHVVREAQAGRPVSALSYLASFMIGNTLLGGIALQLKAMKDGKDPRDMTTPAFWGQAFMQGGGLGIMGDFLFSDQNHYGGGFGQTVVGPVGGLFSDVVGTAQKAAAGKNVGSNVIRLLRTNIPGGANWQYKLILEREIWDQLQSVVDPHASRAWRRKISNTKKYDTRYFWRPGRSILGGDKVRPPNLSNALGQ